MTKAPTAVEQVDQIEVAVKEARERGESIRHELTTLEPCLASVLSAIKPDQAAIKEIEAKRDGLAHEIEFLDKRIDALARSLSAARIQIDEEELERAIVGNPRAH